MALITVASWGSTAVLGAPSTPGAEGETGVRHVRPLAVRCLGGRVEEEARLARPARPACSAAHPPSAGPILFPRDTVSL